MGSRRRVTLGTSLFLVAVGAIVSVIWMFVASRRRATVTDRRDAYY